MLRLVEDRKHTSTQPKNTHKFMNKKFLLALILVAVLAVAAVFILKKKQEPGIAASITQLATDTLAGSTKPLMNERKANAIIWKKYTNQKLGFTFEYPETWVKEEKETKVINLSGAVTEIDLNFSDTVSETSLLVACHLAPKGRILYEYAEEQFQAKKGWYAKDAKEINVGGKKAIQASTTLQTNGKGGALNRPLILIVVDMPDKKQTGEIQLQFKTALADEETEVAKFNQLLSGFKFID